MVFTIRGHLLWKYLSLGARACLRHMSPVTRADSDASVMFSRQDKQIGSDLTKEAGWKATKGTHFKKHFVAFYEFS